MVSLLLSMMALSIAVFSSTMLLSRPPTQHQRPLLLTLLCLAIIACGPWIFQLVPQLRQSYVALLPLCFFSLLVGLTRFHEALLSPAPWTWPSWQKSDLLPTLAAAFVSVQVFVLPSEDFQSLFVLQRDVEHTQAQMVAISFFAAVVLWCLMSFIRLITLVRKTLAYRLELRNIFSSEAGKSMGWVEWLTGILGAGWVYACLVFVFENQFAHLLISEDGVFVWLVALTWLLCTVGLNQVPGFAEVFDDLLPDRPPAQNSDTESEVKVEKTKYQHSALDEQRARRIAEKIQQAIVEDQLYLDDGLTLFKLAKYIGVSSQYLSQTFSQTLNTNFFDYINKARVEAAMAQLQHSKKTVLSIAMDVGFNARSSFYKAFKQHTGLTPSQYKRQVAARISE